MVVIAGEARVAVIKSYPALRGLQLHSLARLVEFECASCARQRQSALVATVAEDFAVMLCPTCFGNANQDAEGPSGADEADASDPAAPANSAAHR